MGVETTIGDFEVQKFREKSGIAELDGIIYGMGLSRENVDLVLNSKFGEIPKPNEYYLLSAISQVAFKIGVGKAAIQRRNNYSTAHLN